MVLIRDLDVERAVSLDRERVARLLLHPRFGALEPVLARASDAGHDLGSAGGEGQFGGENDAHGLLLAVRGDEPVADALAIEVDVSLGGQRGHVLDGLDGHGARRRCIKK